MFKIYILSILLAISVQIDCQCSNKVALTTMKYRSNFGPTSPTKCVELNIGPYTISYNYIIIVNNTQAQITCPLDNIIVSDENRAVIFDFCNTRVSNRPSYLIQKVARNIFVEYKYGSAGTFSVEMSWTSIEPMSNQQPQQPGVPAPAPAPAPSQNVQCGVPAIEMAKNVLMGREAKQKNTLVKGQSAKVIGGMDAIPNSHPWLVYLDNEPGPFCAGALISNQWVLTAADCLDDQKTKQILLGLHSYNAFNKSQNDPKVKVAQVGKIFLHPQYNIFGEAEFLNDIALIKLAAPVQFTREISPICLYQKKPENNTQVLAAGWGLIDLEQFVSSDTLKQAYFMVKDDKACAEVGNVDKNKEICAGNSVAENGEARGLCDLGDMGTPLVVRDQDNRYKVAGVLSYTGDCLGYGVFTNVAAYASSFIIDTMLRNP